MNDTATRQPIRVSEAASGPYIRLTVDSVEKVRKVLTENDIPHWVDNYPVSVDGQPAVTTININQKVDPRRVQDLLDAAG